MIILNSALKKKEETIMKKFERIAVLTIAVAAGIGTYAMLANSEPVKETVDVRYGIEATERFEGAWENEDMRIIVDKETGVNYILYSAGFGQTARFAMTALLDANGAPVITDVESETE